MQVRFWGTRGSIAAPGSSTVRYGGNTSCVEISTGDTVAVMDCGTGARGLGADLVARGGSPEIHLMLTHFHWDHIQGFPFFLPAFLPTSQLHVYGSAGLEQGLEEAMSGQMQYTYFPIRLTDLLSRISFHEVSEDTFRAGSLTVATRYLNHTCPTVGYRLERNGVSVAYVTDHEPYWPHNPDAPLSEAFLHPGDREHANFFGGVDLLIHDAQYLAEEYPAKRGWGHSTVEYVVDLAIVAGARRLALFHHDPPRDDQALDEVLEHARARVAARGSSLEVFAASEGLVIDLPDRAATETPAELPPISAASAPACIAVLGDTDLRRDLRQALMQDGYRLVEATLDAPAGQWLTRNPDIVIAAVRADGSGVVADVAAARRAAGHRPLLAVVEGTVGEGLFKQVAELATDLVVAPFSPPNLRARVRASLVRRKPEAGASREKPKTGLTDSLQILDSMSAAELNTLLEHSTHCTFQPGEIVFRQGDPPTGVYYIHSGLLRLAVDAIDGQEVTVGFASAGDTVGEMSGLDGQPRSATAIAVDAVDCSYVHRDLFRSALENAPRTSVRLLRLLSRRLRDVDLRLANATAQESGEAAGELAPSTQNGAVRRRLARLESLLEQFETSESQLNTYTQEVKSSYTDPHEWRQAIQALRSITHLLGATRSPGSLHRQTLRTLGRMVPFKEAALYLLENQQLMRVETTTQEAPLFWQMESAPALVRESLTTGAPQGESDGRGHTLVIPLRARTETVGVIWLQRESPLTEEEMALGEMVAAACAVVLREREDGEGSRSAQTSTDLFETLRIEMDRARRLGYPIGVLMARLEPDLQTAQEPLLETLRTLLRRTDVVTAGPGGDVGVILPGLAPEHMSRVEAKVLEAIRGSYPPGESDSALHLPVKLTSTVLYPDGTSTERMIERAREALA